MCVKTIVFGHPPNRKGTSMSQRDLAIILGVLSVVTGGFMLYCYKTEDPRQMSALICFVGTAILTWNAIRRLK